MVTSNLLAHVESINNTPRDERAKVGEMPRGGKRPGAGRKLGDRPVHVSAYITTRQYEYIRAMMGEDERVRKSFSSALSLLLDRGVSGREAD